jgi:hypothetical protein
MEIPYVAFCNHEHDNHRGNIYIYIYIYIVTCLTKGYNRIQDTVAPFLEQQVSWIRSRATIVGRSSVSIGTARYYIGKAIGNSELVTCRQRKKLVTRRQRNKLLVGAVQFRQRDPKELRVLSVYYNCNLL